MRRPSERRSEQRGRNHGFWRRAQVPANPRCARPSRSGRVQRRMVCARCPTRSPKAHPRSSPSGSALQVVFPWMCVSTRRAWKYRDQNNSVSSSSSTARTKCCLKSPSSRPMAGGWFSSPSRATAWPSAASSLPSSRTFSASIAPSSRGCGVAAELGHSGWTTTHRSPALSSRCLRASPGAGSPQPLAPPAPARSGRHCRRRSGNCVRRPEVARRLASWAVGQASEGRRLVSSASFPGGLVNYN
mmetsp:Transcript_32529/g.93667  ORF Transcript_32529/g.93667 Transcript_32529/m.93667 type:complete len:244 (+) Transcript_32529:938-1669(+)